MARVFIIGSADGLGRLAAKALIARGHRVVLHDRASLWALVNSIPAEVRDDGVPRPGRAPSSGGNPIRTQEDLMAFLQTLDGPRGRGES